MIYQLGLLKIVFLVALFIVSFKLYAADLRYAVGIEFAQYDNINLDNIPIMEEQATTLRGSLSVLDDNAGLFTSVLANFSTTNYKNNLVSDRNLGDLNANVVWRIEPGKFDWFFRDVFTQTVINPLQSNAIDNRQNVNVFSTGPNYIIRINSQNNVKLEMRGESYQYERNNDNNRGTFSARWFSLLGKSLVVGINNEFELTKFSDEIINTSFKRNDTFLSVNYTRGANSLNAEYGSTRIANVGFPELNTARYLFSYSNTRTRTSTIRILYRNIASDTGRQVVTDSIDDTIDDSINNSSANDIFINESLRFQYLKSMYNGNLSFEVSKGTRDYKLQNELDEENSRAIISGMWAFKRSDSLRYSLNYINTIFLDPATNREDEDYVYTLSYNHVIRRNMFFNIRAISQERVSNIDAQSYEDLRIIFSLNYTSK